MRIQVHYFIKNVADSYNDFYNGNSFKELQWWTYILSTDCTFAWHVNDHLRYAHGDKNSVGTKL